MISSSFRLVLNIFMQNTWKSIKEIKQGNLKRLQVEHEVRPKTFTISQVKLHPMIHNNVGED